MSAPGRRGASIFAQGPAPAGSARGAPIPANKDERRRFPTWSLCPQLRLRGAAPLFVERRAWDLLPRRRQRPASRRPPAAPGSAPSPPPAAPHVLSRAAEGRTVAAAAPRSPPGAASPGDTFPASVGRRPAARPSTPAAGPECRPEACSGHDTLPAGPPRPPGRRVLSGPRLCFPPSGLRDAPGHSWAEAPPLNRPPLCQRHSNILRV